MNTETALEPISLARRALAEATTLPEMQDVQATAVGLRKYARARGLGIEAENPCAEIVYRAERKMGAELIRMAEAKERAGQRGNNRWTFGSDLSKEPRLPTLAALLIDKNEAWRWQQLARIPDEGWESILAERLARSGERLSRDDLVRAYFGDPERRPKSLRDDVDDWTGAWAMARDGVARLGGALDHGWPLQSDRTLRGWREVNDEITALVSAIERDVSLFRRRVRAFIVALDVSSGADEKGAGDDD